MRITKQVQFGLALLAAGAVAYAANNSEPRPLDVIRIKQNGAVVAEVRIARGVTVSSVVQPQAETPTGAVGVLKDGKVRLSFPGGDEIQIKAADAEITREKP